MMSLDKISVNGLSDCMTLHLPGSYYILYILFLTSFRVFLTWRLKVDRGRRCKLACYTLLSNKLGCSQSIT